MFTKPTPDDYRPVLPGIALKTLTYGEKTLLAEFRLSKGSTLPLHAHPHEQTGYLVSGHMRLTIAGEIHDVTPGCAWCILGGVEHSAEIVEDSVAVEAFSPVREDYLPEGTDRSGRNRD
jgi:quercetin dioxygenase-like cupin family protein